MSHFLHRPLSVIVIFFAWEAELTALCENVSQEVKLTSVVKYSPGKYDARLDLTHSPTKNK